MKVAAAHPHVTTHIRYDAPLEDDVAARRCDSVGMLDAELLNQIAAQSDADFYICGPKPFMAQALHVLRRQGIDDSRLHFEFFGPKSDLDVPAAIAS